MVLKSNCDDDDDIPLKETYSNFRHEPLFFCLSSEVMTKKNSFKHLKKCILSLEF